jgi:hypothetical protein
MGIAPGDEDPIDHDELLASGSANKNPNGASGTSEAHGKNASPTMVIAGSQSVKTTEAGGRSGHGSGKKFKGRKQQIDIDTI